MDDKNSTSQAQKLNVPGDMFKNAMDRLVEIGEITDAQRTEIRWFYSYAIENDMNLEDCGSAIKKDSSTISRLFTGRYGASYDHLVDAIQRYHRLASARGSRKSIGFVEISAWTKIDMVCRHALVGKLPAFIYGASQIGKTFCLEEYTRRNNHGQTKLIRIPASPTLNTVRREVASKFNISLKENSQDLSRRIMEAIDDNMLLIVDEIHEALLGEGRGRAVAIFEWLREVYDRCQCGIVFCGTPVFREEIEGGKLALVLEQFRRRSIINLELPSKTPYADIVKIAKAFGLEAPTEDALNIIDAMLIKSGLGQYVKFLQQASNLATNQKKALTWDHFVMAYDVIQSLSNSKRK